MDRRRLILIICAVTALVLVFGAMLLIGTFQGEDTSYGDKPGGTVQLGGLA